MACNCMKRLDSGFRRNDGKRYFQTFYEFITIKTVDNSPFVNLDFFFEPIGAILFFVSGSST